MVSPRIALTFDPFDPAVLADPYPAYTALREAGAAVPLAHGAWRAGSGSAGWAVGRYDDAREVLRDYGTFSSVDGPVLRPGDRPADTGLLVSTDPPNHTHVRRIIAPFFTPPAVARREARIRMRVAEALDAVIGAGEVDVVATVAEPVATGVFCELAGVPTAGPWAADTAERHRELARYVDALVDLAGDTGDREAERRRTLAETGEHLFDLAFGGDFVPGGLGAHLFGAVLADGALDEDESRLLLFSLFVLGIDSMANFLGTALHLLATRPDAWAALRQRPALVGPACEEILRHEPPVQYLFRTATRDVELGATMVSAGDRVLVVHGAANRDPRRFPDPDHFDVTRFARAHQPPQPDHLAFGHGVHLCLGATLARLEARVVLEELLGRVSALELAGEPERKVVNFHRGFRRLPVRLYAA